MALTADQRAELTRRYQTLLAGISTRSSAAVDAAWLDLTNYRDADLADFTKAVAAPTIAAKRAAMTTATGYFALLLGKPAPAIALADIATSYRSEGPFLALWKALNDGHTLTEAAEIGRHQAAAAARNLTISTARTTGDVFAEKANVRISGWVRNAEGKSCAWCQRLDGAVFPSSSAGDFGHDRCNCTVSPVAA